MSEGPIRTDRVITDGAAGLITRVEELAYELKVHEVMTSPVKTVTPDMRMSEVLVLFRDAKVSGAPVVAHGDLVGIVSIADLIRALQENNTDAAVSEYMTMQVTTLEASSPVIEALKLFKTTRVGRLPVVDQAGKLVGIITKGDITRGVLRALENDYQEEEVRKYRASHLFEDIVSDRTSLILRYRIKQGDFAHGGNASSHIKRALLRLGASPQIARRCGIAIYEAEMNLIIHTTNGGTIRVEIEPHQILMETIDDGPGIEDIDLAMTPGYSTAPDSVRELGFGAGMGLKNIQRCVDDMYIDSTVGRGTRLEMRIFMKPEEQLGDANSTGEWAARAGAARAAAREAAREKETIP
ncbi:MAG: CBS domain-containing protein [Anaerolineae bacterium]|nr:CBS domain-containing protein [Thermoflexales bacterium]MDW8406463.1 CBS domain-containing protein [Anaerolineae bacterium]